MYRIFSDFVGTLPTNFQFLVPVTFCILIILLLVLILHLGGWK